MTDLVQRLRGNKVVNNAFELCFEAADRIEALERENAELRKDAARYKWLAWRSDTNPIMPYDYEADRFYHGHECDAAIDAVMEQT